MIVANAFGEGRSVYSAADIECIEGQAGDKVLLSLIRGLLNGPPTFIAETHPAVWMAVADQPDKERYLVGFLNFQPMLPAVPIRQTSFTLRPPAGMKFKSLLALPDREPVKFKTDKSGAMKAKVSDLAVLRMLLAEYE